MKKRVIVSAMSEVKKDNGSKAEHRNYKTIEFSTPSKIAIEDPTGNYIAKVEPKKTSINMYEKSYLDNNMHFGYDSEVGDSFLGDIVTRSVEPYQIPSDKEGEPARTVKTFTTVVLGDTEAADWESKVKAAFRNRGHELASETPTNFSIANQEELAAFEAQKAESKEKVA